MPQTFLGRIAASDGAIRRFAAGGDSAGGAESPVGGVSGGGTGVGVADGAAGGLDCGAAAAAAVGVDVRHDRADLDRLALTDPTSIRTPAEGDGISASTLSVEISSMGSSRATDSPTCLSHFETVPSAIDSPIWGIGTSMRATRASPSFGLAVVSDPFRCVGPGTPSKRPIPPGPGGFPFLSLQYPAR